MGSTCGKSKLYLDQGITWILHENEEGIINHLLTTRFIDDALPSAMLSDKAMATSAAEYDA